MNLKTAACRFAMATAAAVLTIVSICGSLGEGARGGGGGGEGACHYKQAACWPRAPGRKTAGRSPGPVRWPGPAGRTGIGRQPLRSRTSALPAAPPAALHTMPAPLPNPRCICLTFPLLGQQKPRCKHFRYSTRTTTTSRPWQVWCYQSMLMDVLRMASTWR